MRRDDRPLRRDLPEPPRRSQDNYCSAVAQVYRELDEAEMVACHGYQQDWVKSVRQTVRDHLMAELDALGEEGDDE